MTGDRDEGKAALEAARDALLLAFGRRCDADTQARECIRAWLKALPGWRLVPVEATEAQKNTHAMEAIFDSEWSLLVELAPPPPGLEPESERG